jgi:hypothetical protein
MSESNQTNQKRVFVDLLLDYVDFKDQCDRIFPFYAMDKDSYLSPVPSAIGKTKRIAVKLHDRSLELLEALITKKQTTKKDLINAAFRYAVVKRLIYAPDPTDSTNPNLKDKNNV